MVVSFTGRGSDERVINCVFAILERHYSVNICFSSFLYPPHSMAGYVAASILFSLYGFIMGNPFSLLVLLSRYIF